ncbi:hypothetical protein PRVXT_002703 [Proteinivorax tanatarense]|uniref:Uncharacterized protein n=1 Tax=Proteinivorax tanatarense TaxID=1260629 RepID=A0AAU7VKT7_9FIRM
MILFFLLPGLVMGGYAERYFDKTDVHIIYREGFRKYYLRKFFSMIAQVFFVVTIPLLIYWAILNIFATDKIFIEGTINPIGEYIIPSMLILNETMRDLAIKNPDHYVWVSIGIFSITATNYGVFAYSLVNFFKSRILRFIGPVIAVIILDTIFMFLRADPNASFFFDAFNPIFPLTSKEIVGANIVLLLISALLLLTHYLKRKVDG